MIIPRRLLHWGLVVLIIAAVAFISWQVIFKRPFVQVVLPEGVTAVELRRTTGGQTATTKVTKTGNVRLAIGDYDVTYFKGQQTVGLTQSKVKPSFKQSIKATLAAPTHKLATIMHDNAKLVTPLGEGYIFQDTQTNGLSYVSGAGTQDVSASFLLSVTPIDPDMPDADYSTVVNIQPAKEGVVVTTTAAVFLAKSPTDITRLPSSGEEFLHFTSSSYDVRTNRVFVLSSYKKEVFYYDLSNTGQGPRVVYTTPRDINRITAGGGKVAVYFDDVPAVDPNVLRTYALTRQLAPIVFDGSTGQTERTLEDWQGTTLAAISEDGTYMALKKKFATTMSIIELSGSKSFTVPGPDANAWAWQGNKLFFGRSHGLWSVDPAVNGNKVTYVASAGATLNQLTTRDDELLATTTNGFVEKMVSSDVDVDNLLAVRMKSLALKTSGYFITYADFNNQVTATVATKGSFNLGIEESALAASQGPEYQKAVEVIRSVPGGSDVVIKQKDNSIIFLYQYASVPNDEEE